MKKIISPFFIVPMSLVSLPLGAQLRDSYHGHMWEWGFGMLWGPFGMLIWFALLVVLIVLLARLIGRGASSRNEGAEADPLKILKTRLAGGEISEEEFDRLRRKLEE